MTADNPEFSVFEFYPDGSHSRVAHFVTAEQAVQAAHRTTQKPAVLLGIIKKVMITDGAGYCAFLWEDGQIIFPTQDENKA